MKTSHVLLLLATVACAIHMAAGIATLSIDLGSEWIKTGIVKRGVPMDIVLNRETKRKTANVIAIRNGERTFGSAAINTCVKYPANGFRFLLELLGEQVDSQAVTLYKQRFPEHTITAEPVRNTAVFAVGDETYTVEELFAMILQHIVQLGAEFAEEPITSVVLVVPPYFTQANRRALLRAAELADVKVMQLMTSPISAGLNYGVFRRSEFNSTERLLMIYDMGSTSTTATVLGYSTAKDKTTKRTTPQVEVKGIGFDRSLGGFEWDLRVREYLLNEFKTTATKKIKGDPAKNARALGKLLKEAQRVKTVLSANTETSAQVEGLFEDVDFKTKVSRETVEQLCEDLYPRVTGPIEQALAAAGVTMDHIEQLIIIGGAVRMPKVQEQLVAFNNGRDLAKNLNGDEAIALGAAYQAASLSKAFRVQAFNAKDSNIYPIEVVFNRTSEEDDGTQTVRSVSRVIYPRGNPVPQKKILSFSRFEDNFGFSINYGDLSFLSPSSQAFVGSANLSVFDVKGVADVFANNTDNTPKGIKAHFLLDDSGIVSVVKVEANFEEVLPEAPEADEVAESTDAQEGTEVTGTEATESDSSEEATSASADSDSDSENSETDSANAEEGGQSEESGTDDKKEEDETNSDVDASADTNKTTAAPPPAAPKPKEPKTFKFKLAFDTETKDAIDMTTEQLQSSSEKLEAWVRAEKQKQELEEALNNLEAFVFNTRAKIYEEDFERCSSQEERDSLSEQLSAASEWLDEEGWEAPADILKEKLAALNVTAGKVAYRIAEDASRPIAVQQLKASLNTTSFFLNFVRNFTAHQDNDTAPWIAEKDLEELENLMNTTNAWLKTKMDAQDALTCADEVAVTTSSINSKTAKVDRELKYLSRKPKPTPKPKTNTTANAESGEKADSGEEVKDNQEGDQGTEDTEGTAEDPVKDTQETTSDDVEDKPEVETDKATQSSAATDDDEHDEL
eukprot:m.81907 g.81907  ORF g.81907 m.81907 type:complete len:964 (+) comp12658_c1_seq1:574-3465(+)